MYTIKVNRTKNCLILEAFSRKDDVCEIACLRANVWQSRFKTNKKKIFVYFRYKENKHLEARVKFAF